MSAHQSRSAIRWNVMLLAGRPLAICGIAIAGFGTFAVAEYGTALLAMGALLYTSGFVVGWTGKIGKALFYE